MKIVQFTKTLNNTELGKGNTHECYVLVSKKVQHIEKLFDGLQKVTLLHRKEQYTEEIQVHITRDKEFRINGLGEFYKNNDVNAGDTIIFEKQEQEQKKVIYVSLRQRNDTILFRYYREKGFEILNIERLHEVLTKKKISFPNIKCLFVKEIPKGTLDITFNKQAKKRKDSPSMTNFYSLTFTPQNLLEEDITIDLADKVKSKDYLSFVMEAEKIEMVAWHFHEINVDG